MEKKVNNNKEKGRKSFGGLRNESKRIDYLAELISNNKNLDANEEGFLEIHREAIYAKVNEIKNYEDDPNILSVELNKQVANIEDDQTKGQDIVSQIDNPTDKEEGEEELNQITKDTDQVVNKVQTEVELITEIQNTKKNLSKEELNDLSGIEKIKIKKYPGDKKIQVSEAGNKIFEDEAKNAMDAYKVAIKGLEQIEESLPEDENIPNDKENNIPNLSNKTEERAKSDFEKIYEVLSSSEQKEVDSLLDKGVADFREKREKLIKEGKTPEEASVETYQEWLKTEDGIKYQEILSKAEKRITKSGTPDNIYNRDLDLKTQASILNDLTNQEIEIKDKYFSIKEKLEKNEGLTEDEKKELETELAKYEQLRQEINDKIGKQTEKVNELKAKKESEDKEKIIPIIEKNEIVLNEIQKQQLEKVNAFLNEKKEQKTGFFKKTLDWWNNLENKKIKIGNKEFASGKIAKTVMSAGFIGTALYFAGDKLDLLPKNQTVAQKIASRTFLAGLSSAIITSNFTQNTLGSIKEKWSKLGTTGKIVAGTALGVGGAGAFIYFAGATTLGITIGAVGAKLGLNKVLFDKKIDAFKTEKEKAEKRIEELNAKIKSFENDPTFDVEAFMQQLPAVQNELNKYNNKLRNWKIGKSLTSGLISLGSGLGSMAASHLEVNDKAREFIDNGIKKTGGIFKNLSEKIKNVNFKDGVGKVEKDLDKDMIDNNDTGGGKGPGGENEVIDKDQNKFDIKNIKPEAIIDGQSRVGITYAFRDQLCADEELARKLGIEDSSKLNDPAYVAKITKEIAMKTGYMDSEGHEIRINKEGVGKIAYVLGVDPEGKIEVKEIDTATGEVLETHCEGDTFEGTGKDKYEYEKLQKTYSKIEEAYDKNGGLVKPERVVSTLDDPFSNSYFNEDDSREYFENQAKDNIGGTPDSLKEEDIVAPEKVAQVYKFENITNYKDWNKIKDLSLKTFLERAQYSDIYGQEGKELMIGLKEANEKVLVFIDNDEEFNKFILSNPDLTVQEATALYKDITGEQGFTEELKEKYGFYDWKDSLKENVRLTEEKIKELKVFKDVMKGDNEVKKIFKLNYGKKIFDNENDFLNNKEVRAIYFEYNKNIKTLDEKMFGDLTQIMKNNTVNNYLEKNENILTDYLTEVREKLGDLAKPQRNWGAGEKIDEYLKRITALAKIKRINIDPKFILKQEDIDKTNLDKIEEYRPSSSFKEDRGDLSKIKNDELNEYKPSKREAAQEGISDDQYKSFKQDTKSTDAENYNQYKPYNKNNTKN